MQQTLTVTLLHIASFIPVVCRHANQISFRSVHLVTLLELYFIGTQIKLQKSWMDGWMTCDFTSFSTVFQSYQDDGQMIMKGCVQWDPVYG